MEIKLTERQQRFIALAATHADDFQTRVAQHDRENTFAFENVEAMKASGYTALPIPEEFGGSGATPLELALAQERLGYGDLPTAIAINMHFAIACLVADIWRLGKIEANPLADAAEGLLESMGRKGVIMAGPVSDSKMHSGVGNAAVNDTTRRADRVDGGYLVNGRTGFGTMTAAADIIFSSAHYDDPKKGPQCLLFFIPTKAPGINIQNNWDTLGIRASASNDILWENVFVPDESVILRPARTWDVIANLVVAWWAPNGPACYLGLGQAARDHAYKWLNGRTQVPFDRPMSHYPSNQFFAADVEMGIRASRALLLQTAAAIDDVATRANPSLIQLVSCYKFVMETMVSVVDKCMRMVGGAAFFRSNPLEQMYRDVRAAAIHQPIGGVDGLAMIGKMALGIPHDILPRWV